MSNEKGIVQFKVDTSKVDGYLPAKGDAVVAALMERVNAVNKALLEKIHGKTSGDPIKVRTNKLYYSERIIPATNDGAKISGGVQAGGGPAFYVKFLEDGSKAHIIEAIGDGKRALAFMIDGKTILRKLVHHPGTPAYHFMSGTLDESKDEIIAAMQTAVTEAVK
jgi:hypothetical protein